MKFEVGEKVIHKGKERIISFISESYCALHDMDDNPAGGGIHRSELSEPLTPENQSGRFKVGDAVKVVDGSFSMYCEDKSYPGNICRDKNGNEYRYIILSIGEYPMRETNSFDSFNKYKVRRIEDGKELYVNYIERIEPMPTYKDDKYEYTALKSLSPKSLLDASPCNIEFNKYCKTFGFYNEPTLEQVIIACKYKSNPEWLPWLKSHGYVGVEEIKQYKFVSGDRYTISGETYVLTILFMNNKKYISLVNTNTGGSWSEMAERKSENISIDEFKIICGGRNVDEVYKTRKTYSY
jgi:hypothetical protein